MLTPWIRGRIGWLATIDGHRFIRGEWNLAMGFGIIRSSHLWKRSAQKKMCRARAGHLYFLPFPTRPCFCPPSPNNLECLLALSKNLAHPLHPVYDDSKGGGWKWWE